MIGEIIESVEGKKFKVVRSKGDSYFIRFEDTGYTCRARKHLVRSGRVYDPTKYLEELDSWKEYRKVFTNNDGEVFESTLKRERKIKVFFPKSGYFTEVYESNAKLGKVKDPYSITVYGKGYLGCFDKGIPYWKQAKQLWNNLMKRCYDDNYETGYFGEAEVDDRWLSFENFLNDIHKLDGFEGWLNWEESGIKFNLDKDLIKSGNRTYSRHLCCFIPESFNKAMGKNKKDFSDWV